MTQWRRKTSADEVYDADEIAARLAAELPRWTYEDGWIRRKYKTSGWKATLMVVNTVGHLAEAAWHHPDLTVSYAFVIVKLVNHAAKGVTDKDFELARKIEEVLADPGRRARMAAQMTQALEKVRRLVDLIRRRFPRWSPNSGARSHPARPWSA